MPPNITSLEQRIKEIEAKLEGLIRSDRYILQKDLEFQDGRNIQLATGTGTMLGTSASQKLGFFGITPRVQQAYISHPAADVNSLQTALDTLLTELENYGIIDPTP